MHQPQAIDMHIHLNDDVALAARGRSARQMSRYFGRDRQPVSIDELADMYRSRNMMAVIMATTDVTITGEPPIPNDHVSAAVRAHPDVFFGFGAIDPWQGQLAINEVKRCIEELGLHGIGELNPGRQHFFPNDTRFYPIWETVGRLGVPVLFHTGMAAAGAGTPGGGGVKLKYTRPIPYLDDLAADFPDLKIIGAHPSWPYEAESLAIARHKANFYIDLSGWAPKYFSDQLIQYINTILASKTLFGSDWPGIDLERWLREFDQIELKPESRERIMLTNALQLLKQK